MKQKNTNISFWSLMSALYFAVLVFLFAGSTLLILLELVNGNYEAADVGKVLLQELLGWVFLVSFSVSLWLRWRELRRTATIRQLLGKKFLAVLVVFGVIATGPWWLPIRMEGEPVGLEILMVAYALYLCFAGLFLLVPCFLIYSLGRALGEKEMEKEEMDEARKY